MANFLAYRIIAGKLEFKNVPEVLRDKVKQILIDKGHQDMVG